MPQRITYSNGAVVEQAVIVVWDDSHAERSGYYRAYWCDSPTATTGSPVIGYCSPGGSHKTVRAVALEVLRLYPGETVYRNGRPVRIIHPART